MMKNIDLMLEYTLISVSAERNHIMVYGKIIWLK